MRRLFYCLLPLFIFGGCLDNPFKEKRKKSRVEGTPLTGNHFTSEKIGWTIKLPGKEWKIIPKSERKQSNAKAKKNIEKSTGVVIDNSKVQELISFRKDDRNNFISLIEPFNKATDGNYEQVLYMQHELFKTTYSEKNIPAKYEIGATRIGGVMIDWFNVMIDIPGKEKKVFTLRMFSCLVNKYFFSMVVSYDNKMDEETLMNVVYSSTFSIKN